MKELPVSAVRSALSSTIATSVLGGVLGGSFAAALVIGFTEVLKLMLGMVSRQHTWVIVLGQGGPYLAMLTCLVAGSAGTLVASLVGHSYIEKKPRQIET
jgi:hypothetical protein